MTISATEVKALRDRTGAGMMECKRALSEAGGDLERAVEIMRKSGLAKADKKAGRTTAEGRIALVGDDKAAAMVEINSETDFVAGGEDLARFANEVAELVLAKAPRDTAEAATLVLPSGKTVDELRRELVAKLGENVTLRRIARLETTAGTIGRYLHGSRIGVLVELERANQEVAKDVAMHVAASHPLCVHPEDVPANRVESERRIHRAQAEDSGKPPEIVAKMVEGRLRKYLDEVALTGQPFVKDPDISVGSLLKRSGARVMGFVRFEVGEGIEKKEADFASEVMSQVRGR